MEVVETVEDVRRAVAAARRRGARIGFVPTMGALHEGHAALIRRARAGSDYRVVSIFVNPLQFGPREDLDRYPRTLEADLSLCRELGVDLVFTPTIEEMYPRRQATFVEVEGLTDTLCGASRPGHFRGVATVVAKLFHIVQPDVAYFGEKDAQQALVIQRMVEDLNFPVTIEVCPTVREPDGLALSSRNRYLNPEERRAATVLYRALSRAREAFEAGERDTGRLRELILAVLNEEPLARVDYAEVVDRFTLEPVATADRPVLAAVAVYIGQARLIDNMTLDPAGGSGAPSSG